MEMWKYIFQNTFVLLVALQTKSGGHHNSPLGTMVTNFRKSCLSNLIVAPEEKVRGNTNIFSNHYLGTFIYLLRQCEIFRGTYFQYLNKIFITLSYKVYNKVNLGIGVFHPCEHYSVKKPFKRQPLKGCSKLVGLSLTISRRDADPDQQDLQT